MNSDQIGGLLWSVEKGFQNCHCKSCGFLRLKIYVIWIKMATNGKKNIPELCWFINMDLQVKEKTLKTLVPIMCTKLLQSRHKMAHNHTTLTNHQK